MAASPVALGAATDPIHSTALLLVGCWLLIYRLALRIPHCRPAFEAVTTACCGTSLSLLAPLMPFGGMGLRAPFLAGVGILLSFCHTAFTALVVAVALGAGVSGMLWQLWACAAAEGVSYLHPALFFFVCLTFAVLFVCTPGVAGPGSMTVVVLPTLGALLVVVGLSGMDGGLSPEALLAEAPCPADVAFFTKGLGWPRTPWECLAAWLALAVLSASLQLLLSAINKGKVEAEIAEKGDLVAHLLPSAQDPDGPARLPRPNQAESRFGMITQAIYADEGADLSHLTETERKIVEVCRKDEFERDRILWGGGLI